MLDWPAKGGGGGGQSGPVQSSPGSPTHTGSRQSTIDDSLLLSARLEMREQGICRASCEPSRRVVFEEPVKHKLANPSELMPNAQQPEHDASTLLAGKSSESTGGLNEELGACKTASRQPASSSKSVAYRGSAFLFFHPLRTIAR